MPFFAGNNLFLYSSIIAKNCDQSSPLSKFRFPFSSIYCVQYLFESSSRHDFKSKLLIDLFFCIKIEKFIVPIEFLFLSQIPLLFEKMNPSDIEEIEYVIFPTVILSFSTPDRLESPAKLLGKFGVL